MENRGVRSILCFGDSNTWGFTPGTGERYPRSVRWPGLLQAALGDTAHVIEEGLCGRTTVFGDPHIEIRNGKRALPYCLETHKPLDTVILMLGTNDCMHKHSATPFDIARGMSVLVEMTRASGVNDILVIAPAPITKLTAFAEPFEGGREKSQLLAERYAAMAAQFGVAFLDAGSVVRSSDLDGFHLDANAHRTLAASIERAIVKR
ncbi:MAG: hypothetical protein FJW32_23860 [Acidobacteria bacterium]|nr:hypothetical protein [Acidobacteriota bacterium]